MSKHQDAQPLARTPLYDEHRRVHARIIPFAGWEMPVQYPTGIIAEHRAVRTGVGLFDLGHMGQVLVDGPDALAFLQRITTNDASRLEPGQAQYSLLPTPEGGVIDDILVYRAPANARDSFGPAAAAPYFVVVNASNRERDVAWLQHHARTWDDLKVDVWDMSSQIGMFAVQGPKAASLLERFVGSSLDDLDNYWWRGVEIDGIPLMLARTGYTGEDGFELYPPIGSVPKLWRLAMESGEDLSVSPIGLGARDTLRLEARMPLYGQELAEDINPYEAGVGWAVKLKKDTFIGHDALTSFKANGPARRTVGFQLTERSGAPRTGYPVALEGETIGHVTSGAFSPTFETNIGLALVRSEFVGIGRPLQVIIRGKAVPAEQVRVPFYRRETDD